MLFAHWWTTGGGHNFSDRQPERVAEPGLKGNNRRWRGGAEDEDEEWMQEWTAKRPLHR